MLAVSVADKRILQLLEDGKRIESVEVQEQVNKIVAHVLKQPLIADAAAVHRLGLNELAIIYTLSTATLGERMTISHGGRIIATSLVFMDFQRFPMFLQIITNQGELNGAEHLDDILVNAIQAVSDLRDKAIAERGSPSRSGRQSGCLLMLTLLSVGCLAFYSLTVQCV